MHARRWLARAVVNPPKFVEGFFLNPVLKKKRDFGSERRRARPPSSGAEETHLGSLDPIDIVLDHSVDWFETKGNMHSGAVWFRRCFATHFIRSHFSGWPSHMPRMAQTLDPVGCLKKRLTAHPRCEVRQCGAGCAQCWRVRGSCRAWPAG